MSSINFALQPKEFIAEVRARYKIDDPGSEMLHQELNEALKLLSVELYSDDTHFVSELIQNADDNEYKPDIDPRLSFTLKPNRLIVSNNENGFSAKNVFALCRIGSSTKKGNKHKTGEKGIGFKSVFTVSDAPEIHSNGFHFKFDRTDKSKLLGFVVPTWIDSVPEAEDGQTAIVLPAPGNSRFDASKLNGLDPTLLLFLRQLRQIEIHQPGEQRAFHRSDHGNISVLTHSTHLDGDTQKDDRQLYLRTEHVVDMNSIVEEKRPTTKETQVVLAFPISETYDAKPDIDGSKIFAFLPVAQAGFRFSIQADFVLSASRGAIKENLPWNIKLRSEIANAFVNSHAHFKNHPPLQNGYFEFLPRKNEVSGEFLRPVRNVIIDLLIRAKCIRSASGTWCIPADIRTAGKRFRELFPSETARLLFGYDYLDEGQRIDAELLEDLKIQSTSSGDVISLFTHHLKWFQEQSKEWQQSLYTYIGDFHEKFIKDGLLDVPFLPLDDGTMLAPKDQVIYFPLGKGKKYGFEHYLKILRSELFSFDDEHALKTAKFLVAVGVRTDNPYDMIVGHIIPRHISGDWKKTGDGALLGHLRYIKDKCDEYLAGAARLHQPEAEALKLLGDKLFIGTKWRNQEGSWVFDYAKNLYVGDAYLPDFSVERYPEAGLKPMAFVSEEYLSKRSKNEVEVAASWRAFFARIGIREVPKVVSVNRDWACSTELSMLLNSPDAKARIECLLCISRNWHLYEDKVSMQSPLAAIRGQVFRTDSSFVKALRATVVSASRKVPATLNQCYYPSDEIKAMMGNSVTYVDERLCMPMLEACQVSCTLNARVLVKRLQQIKENDSGDTARAIQKVYGRIEEIYEDDKDFILRSFKEHSLIRVKGPHKSWRKPDEVCWESSGAFLDSVCPPLEGQYRDFSGFFEKLGVRREISIQRRIDALEQLGNLEPKEDRRKVALAIYERLSRLLRKITSTDGNLPSWVDEFRTRALFLDQEGRMVEKDNDLFVDDAPQISKHFADAPELSFLWVPQSALPSLHKFLDATAVPLLSASFTSALISHEQGEPDDYLTSMVRQFSPYFAQILHARDHDAFELAQEAGALKALQSIEIYVTDEVLLAVSLAGIERNVSVEIARSSKRIVYKRGARSVKDKIASQLCGFLGAKATLEDMFTRVMIEGSVAAIEEFLDEKQIGQLPEDTLFEPEIDDGFDSSADEGDGGLSEGVGNSIEQIENPAENHPDHVEPQPEPTHRGRAGGTAERGPQAQRGTGTATGGLPGNDPPVDTRDPAENRGVAGNFDGRSHSPRGSTEGDHRSNGSGQLDGNSRTVGTKTPEISGHTDRVQEPSISGIGTTKNPSGSTSEQTVPDQPRLHPVSDDSSRPARQPTSGPTTDRSPGNRKTGTSNKRTTRTGHLLSYVLLKEPSIDDENREANSEAALEKRRTGSLAVKFFLENQATRWQSLTEMPELNPGFDVLAVAHDGEEEFIEVKGQTSEWTERGVTLTPRELEEAQKRRGRYWLCVVEYVYDETRRRLYLFQDPFGLTDQFKFDSGWKAAAIAVNAAPLRPEVGRYIEIAGEGRAKIISVIRRGKLSHLHVIFDDGRQKNLLFKPDKMTVSEQ